MCNLRARRDNANGGKKYWSDGFRVLGVYETEHGLMLEKPKIPDDMQQGISATQEDEESPLPNSEGEAQDDEPIPPDPDHTAL